MKWYLRYLLTTLFAVLVSLLVLSRFTRHIAGKTWLVAIRACNDDFNLPSAPISMFWWLLHDTGFVTISFFLVMTLYKLPLHTTSSAPAFVTSMIHYKHPNTFLVLLSLLFTFEAGIIFLTHFALQLPLLVLRGMLLLTIGYALLFLSNTNLSSDQHTLNSQFFTSPWSQHLQLTRFYHYLLFYWLPWAFMLFVHALGHSLRYLVVVIVGSVFILAWSACKAWYGQFTWSSVTLSFFLYGVVDAHPSPLLGLLQKDDPVAKAMHAKMTTLIFLGSLATLVGLLGYLRIYELAVVRTLDQNPPIVAHHQRSPHSQPDMHTTPFGSPALSYDEGLHSTHYLPIKSDVSMNKHTATRPLNSAMSALMVLSTLSKSSSGTH